MFRGVTRAVGLVALAVAVVGCGEPPPPAPSAVIRACPASLCVGDDFATSVHLDAKKSAPRLTLVEAPREPDEPPLQLLWSFAGAEMLFDDESVPTSADILVSSRADRPLHVTLRVENAAGGVSEALKTISITPLGDDGSCPLPDPIDDDSEDCLAIGPAGL